MSDMRRERFLFILTLSFLGMFVFPSHGSAADPHPDDPLPKNAKRSTSLLMDRTSVLSTGSSSLNSGQGVMREQEVIVAADTDDLDALERSLEKQDQEIAQNVDEILGDSLTVTETDKSIEIQVDSDVLFDFNRWGIRPDAEATLLELAKIIKKHGDLRVTLGGHTDAVGTADYNKKLSVQRAKSVQSWLIHKASLYSVSMKAVGYGESRPIATNTNPNGSDNPAGRQKNRRVEIRIDK